MLWIDGERELVYCGLMLWCCRWVGWRGKMNIGMRGRIGYNLLLTYFGRLLFWVDGERELMYCGLMMRCCRGVGWRGHMDIGMRDRIGYNKLGLRKGDRGL